MAALFAAEIQVPFDHFLDDVAIPNFRPDDFPAVLGQRFIEAEIAHDGRDERRVFQPAALE